MQNSVQVHTPAAMKGGARTLGPLAAIKPGDLPLHLPLLGPRLEVSPLIRFVLARAHSKFNLHEVPLPVQAQRYDAVSLDVGLLKKLPDLQPV